MNPDDLVEVIVRPRRRLWHRGRTHLPGARLFVTEDEYGALVGRAVRLATDDAVAAVAEAIARGYPCELDYEPPTAFEADDVVSDVRKLGSRVDERKAAKTPRRRASQQRHT